MHSFVRQLALVTFAVLSVIDIPAALAAPVEQGKKSDNKFHELSVVDTQRLLISGEVSLQALKQYYLERLRKIDDQGPTLNAVVRINPQLQDILAKQQIKIDAGQALGPLFGAFVVLKDNIDTGDGMPNTAGSWLMREHVPNENAFLVDQLIAADAIILGKTNLSEWANFRSTHSSSGWSSLYGQTLNPYDLSRSPCGSSSGSGVAIAADFATLAVGTETDGSVTCPAAINGIVGIKPTLGLVSRQGIIPIAHSQDTAGPMARTVADAVVLLEAMMGKDTADKAALAPMPLRRHLIAEGLQGKRVGVVTNLQGYHPGLDAVFKRQLEVFEQQGAILVDVALENIGVWEEDEFTVLLAEFKADLNQYLKHSQAPLNSLTHAIEMNRVHRAKTMPVFGQEIFLLARDAPSVNSKEYRAALKRGKRLAGRQGIDATLATHNLDLLIAPTTAPAWKIDHVIGDNYLGAASSAPAISGYPHITVPMGDVSGLPVGISFFAGHLSEGVLIESAYAYEQASKMRRSPRL